MSKTKDFSEELAALIESKINILVVELISERRSNDESEYLKLLSEQSKHRVGIMEYNHIGQRLALAKRRKAASNQALNNVKRDNKYRKLKDFVWDNYGYDVFKKFQELNGFQDDEN